MAACRDNNAPGGLLKPLLARGSVVECGHKTSYWQKNYLNGKHDGHAHFTNREKQL